MCMACTTSIPNSNHKMTGCKLSKTSEINAVKVYIFCIFQVEFRIDFHRRQLFVIYGDQRPVESPPIDVGIQVKPLLQSM